MTVKTLPSVDDRICAAMSYVKRGWSLVPLNGKKPTVTNWPKLPPTTPEQACEYSAAGNFGIRTGAISGVVVVDVDPKNGGMESLKKLNMPKTPTVKTGGGGFHFYFKYPEGGIGNSAGKVAPGIDIRADGGQVVASTSIHPDTGKPYEWAIHPDDCPLAELPPDILKRLREKPRQTNKANYNGDMPPLTDRIKRASAYLSKMDGSISGERGHNNLYKAAIALIRGFSLPDDVAFELLLNEFNRRCIPSWTEKEIRHKIDEAAKADTQDGYLLNGANHFKTLEYDPIDLPPTVKRGAKDDAGEKTNTATRLIQLVEAEKIDLFHSSDGKAFAIVQIKARKETLPLSGKGFKSWLEGEYWKRYKKPANSQAVADAMGVLKAKAQFEGKEYPVFTRIAYQDGKVFINLAGDRSRVVEVSPMSWKILDESEVRFIKSQNLAKMPEPESNGEIETLREFINIQDDDTWRLVVAWLVAAFLEGPFTILAVVGESGCAKSTLSRVLSRLVDPSEADLRSLPRNERDLMITAVNGWLLAFDNVSGLPTWLSDAFCRLSTGSGFSTRELYTNSEETIIKAKLPILLNGIDDMANRGDLLSRTLLLSLFPMKETLDEKEFWTRFEKARPKIFGSLLDILSQVLSILPSLKVKNLPRMADFARIGVAVEKALNWPEGSFLQAYTRNRNKSSSLPLESLFAESVIDFIRGKKEWEGTASELLSELNCIVDLDKRKNVKEWPKTPQIIGSKLRRLAPNLRTVGIDIQPDRSGEKRAFRITRDRTEKSLSLLSQPSQKHKNSFKNDNDDNNDGIFTNFSSRTRKDADKERRTIKL